MMADQMSIEQYRAVTESVEGLTHRLRENDRQLQEARALVRRLEAHAVELTERLIAAHDAEVA